MFDKFFSRFLKATPGELRLVEPSFFFFFSTLSAYYLIRPVRETMSTIIGAARLNTIFAIVFVVMFLAVPIYSLLVARLERKKLVPLVYRFFSACFLVFSGPLTLETEPSLILAGSFFVLVSVFSLFVVSVFWSVMADVFVSEQSKSFFGVIAAGGSLGALFSSLLVSMFADRLGLGLIICISVVFLELAVFFSKQLECACTENQQKTSIKKQVGTGGSIWEGFSSVFKSPYLLLICLFLLLAKFCATNIYLQFIEIVQHDIVDVEQRTRLFAVENLLVQVVSICLQVFVSARLMKSAGLSLTLAIMPLGIFVALGAILLQPVLLVFLVVQVLQRSFAYGIASPAEKVLFTVVSREEKYKSKSFIDTVVSRGRDVASSSIYRYLIAIGWASEMIMFLSIPVALAWLLVAYLLGREQQRRASPSS